MLALAVSVNEPLSLIYITAKPKATSLPLGSWGILLMTCSHREKAKKIKEQSEEIKKNFAYTFAFARCERTLTVYITATAAATEIKEKNRFRFRF